MSNYRDSVDDDLVEVKRGKPKKLREKRATPDETGLEGFVVEGARGQYWVETEQGRLLCQLRGNLRKDLLYAASSHLSGSALHHKVRRANVKARDPVSVGGRVLVVPMGADRGLIVEVLAHEGGAFAREDAGAGQGGTGTARSVVGIDQLVAVFALRDPEAHLRMLDRMLVLAEAQELGVVVCMNKADLGADHDLLERLEVYRVLGYPVLLTSTATGQAVDELRARLAGHTSALLGPSGVGKSSLLNAIEPDLGLRVSEISESTTKGRHTTTGTRMVPLAGPGGGFVADTAGIRALGLGNAAVGQLDWCFRELRPYLGSCHHDDCSHVHEPSCAVLAALEAGEIDRPRYESYRTLVEQGAATGGRVWRDLVSSRSAVGEGEFRL